MIAINQLSNILDESTMELTAMSGKRLAIEIEHQTEDGSRFIKGKLSSTLRADGLPEIESVSVRYDNPDVEKWGLSKPELVYILQNARKEMSNEFVDAHTVKLSLPRIGQYFGIEGHSNFMKEYHHDYPGQGLIGFTCGTGNNSYERSYLGKFILVDNNDNTELFCIGHMYRNRISSQNDLVHYQKVMGEKPRLRHCLSIQSDGRMNHAYK